LYINDIIDDIDVHCTLICTLIAVFQPTVLMVAADVDAADCVKLLLDHGASVYDTDEEGYSALCRAILYGRK